MKATVLMKYVCPYSGYRALKGSIASCNITRANNLLTLHKKIIFPLRISSVNVTKSAENCGFGHIY